MVFVVAVLLHPEVQTMAQKELDAATRGERLPTFEDRLKLPFVDAICKEVIHQEECQDFFRSFKR